MKRITYDCEFLERPGKIDAISIGLVDLDDFSREFYAVYDDFDTRAVAADWWLMKNVMNSIEHDQFITADFEGAPVVRDIYPTGPHVMSRADIAKGIQELAGDEEVEFWAWYGCYDHVVLAQTFGRMVDFPGNFPYYTDDIRSLHKRKGNPDLPPQPPGKHNALADARHNVIRFHYLESLPDPGPEA